MMMVQHANERPWNSERKAPLGGRLHVGSRATSGLSESVEVGERTRGGEHH